MRVCVLKGIYFMTVIDGEFCLKMVLYKDPSNVSVVPLGWSKVMGCYNSYTVVKQNEV